MAIRYGLYLTIGRDSKGRLLALCSDGSPQRGHDDAIILSVEVVENEAAADAWFMRMQLERPWETRQ